MQLLNGVERAVLKHAEKPSELWDEYSSPRLESLSSYMAVMLNMTDVVDGFSFTPRDFLPFPLVQLRSITRIVSMSSLAR